MPTGPDRIPSTDPMTRPFRVVVSQLPHPEISPVQIIEKRDRLILAIHPGEVAETVLPAAIAQMATFYRPELGLWVAGFGHNGVSLDRFIADPWRFAGHQRGLIARHENLPLHLRFET